MATGCDVQVQVLQVKVYDMCVKMRLLRQMLEIFVSFFCVCVFFLFFVCIFFFSSPYAAQSLGRPILHKLRPAMPVDFA
jgi:hypothetical protein